MPPETPETAREVPAELVAILGQRMYDASHESCDDYCHGAPLAMFETIAHEHLTAVLPAHEAMVRAKVAEEIEDEDSDPSSEYERGLSVAARIARGELP